jgi:hypothetical protein
MPYKNMSEEHVSHNAQIIPSPIVQMKHKTNVSIIVYPPIVSNLSLLSMSFLSSSVLTSIIHYVLRLPTELYPLISIPLLFWAVLSSFINFS